MVTWSARKHLISQKSLQEHMHLKTFSVLAVLQDAWQERSAQERKLRVFLEKLLGNPMKKNKTRIDKRPYSTTQYYCMNCYQRHFDRFQHLFLKKSFKWG